MVHVVRSKFLSHRNELRVNAIASVRFFKVTLSSLLFLCSLFVGDAHAQNSRVLRIGGIFDLTGGGAVWGKTERNSFELAINDFRRRHPEVEVESRIEDSMFSARQTVTAFQKLVSIERISFVVGPTWETAVAMMPLCEAKGIVCFLPSYNGKEFSSRSWRYNFTAWFEDRGYASAIVDHLQRESISSLALFAALTPYYDGLVETLEREVRSSIVSNQRVTLEERDFRALIARVPRHVGALVMLLDNAGQIQAFLKQWSELRIDRPAIYTDDLILYLDPPDDVLRYGFQFRYSFPMMDEKRQAEFVRRYEAEFKVRPEGSSGSVAYDETMILLECMLRNGPDSGQVRGCIGGTNNYPGYSGTISFAGRQSATGRTMGIRLLS